MRRQQKKWHFCFGAASSGEAACKNKTECEKFAVPSAINFTGAGG